MKLKSDLVDFLRNVKRSTIFVWNIIQYGIYLIKPRCPALNGITINHVFSTIKFTGEIDTFSNTGPHKVSECGQ